jgi:microcystin-dependent protein
MWDESEIPIPEPQSSFERPVPLVLVDPDTDANWQVQFRSEWLPYVLGSLQQLLLPTTWATSDADAVTLAQARASLLIDQFIQGFITSTPEADCVIYPPSAALVSYAPKNPYTQAGEIPDGYIAPPFYVVTNDLLTLLFEGAEVGDVITGYLSLPVLTPALGEGLARFRINLIGSGAVEIHLVNIPGGGACFITHDDNPLTGVMLELNRDLVQVPPETTSEIIHERKFETGGPHHIDVTFLPRFDDTALFIGYGGGLRKVVLCGFEDMFMDVRQNPDDPRILDKTNDGSTWNPFADFNGVSIDGVDGREVEIRNSGTYIQWRYVGDVAWTDIVSIASITGANGTNGSNGSNGSNGTNGREVEIRNSGTYIQWRYVGDVAWTDLISVASITGATGATGPAGPKIVGTIFQYVTASVPSGCLDCDGSSHLRIDYPALYAALHANYKTDADHFVVPDFRGRAPIGIGTGAGLTARAMKDNVGEQTHVLTLTESPSHFHSVTAWGGAHTSTGTNIDQSSGATGSTAHPTDSKGSDGAHNNMQPSHAVGFCIVATA